MVALLLFVSLLLPATQATAASGSCGTSSNRFSGYSIHPTNTFMNGVSAWIKLRTWGNCTSAGFHADSEWVMIQPSNPGSGQNGWVQIGYQHDTNGNFKFFWQVFNGTSCCSGSAWGSPSVGANDQFTVERDNPSGCSSSSGYCLTMKLNGTRCHQENGVQVCMLTTFDPHTLWSNGTFATAAGEVDYAGDDMAGYSTSHTLWTLLSEKDGGTWINTDPLSVTGPTCAWFKHSNGGSTSSFDSWTDPVNHNTSC